MSDVSKVAGSSSRLWHDVLGWFRGKAQPALEVDAHAFLLDCERVGAGLHGAAPDAPGLLSDVETLVADGSRIAASRGMDLPALFAAAQTLRKSVADVEKAYADYCTAAALVALAPKPPA